MQSSMASLLSLSRWTALRSSIPKSFLVKLRLERRGDLYALRSYFEQREKASKNKETEERKQSPKTPPYK